MMIVTHAGEPGSTDEKEPTFIRFVRVLVVGVGYLLAAGIAGFIVTEIYTTGGRWPWISIPAGLAAGTFGGVLAMKRPAHLLVRGGLLVGPTLIGPSLIWVPAFLVWSPSGGAEPHADLGFLFVGAGLVAGSVVLAIIGFVVGIGLTIFLKP